MKRGATGASMAADVAPSKRLANLGNRLQISVFLTESRIPSPLLRY